MWASWSPRNFPKGAQYAGESMSSDAKKVVDAATNRALVEEAGLEIERAEVIGEEENGEMVRFLWVAARRP